MAKSVFSLDVKTTVAQDAKEDENYFDAESICSTESLLLEEAHRREEAAKEAEYGRARGAAEEKDSPMPVKGDIFKDFDPTAMQQKIRKEAA